MGHRIVVTPFHSAVHVWDCGAARPILDCAGTSEQGVTSVGMLNSMSAARLRDGRGTGTDLCRYARRNAR